MTKDELQSCIRDILSMRITITPLTRNVLVAELSELLIQQDIPSTLEKQIRDQAAAGVRDAIKAELVGYNKPLNNLAESVINNNRNRLYDIMDAGINNLLDEEEFVVELQSSLNQKLARTLIQKFGGELEKQVNALKQNPETRAKIMLAITTIVAEAQTNANTRLS